MGTAAAINMLLTILSSLATLASQAGIISDMIKKAQAEGRDTLTEAEWGAILGADDAAREELRKAIG